MQLVPNDTGDVEYSVIFVHEIQSILDSFRNHAGN